MQLIPAIDLKDGVCVRLFQGDFDKVTEYANDPPAVARRFDAMGFEQLHVVDLDGAKSGKQRHQDLISTIASESSLTIQLGGGIRDSRTLAAWLNSGVAKCVVGSTAVNDPGLVREWYREFGAECIVLALDVRIDNTAVPLIAINGWVATSDVSLWQCIDDFQSIGFTQVLCTDVSRDGAMSGPNLELYVEFVTRYPQLRLQASGGIRNLNDIKKLRDIGVHAAITGRALLDGKVTEQEVRSFLLDA